MRIIAARPEDARSIGEAIAEAIGVEIVENLAGNNHTPEDVINMFASLAERDDTQYSYRNSLVAVDEDGKVCGVCIGYDGALLHELRIPFFSAAKLNLGLNLEDVEDECQPDEFYLDTIAVAYSHRGRGIATKLLKAMIDRAGHLGKPAGLLVDKTNSRARRLYEHVGFVKVDERPFVHVMMDHMQYLL